MKSALGLVEEAETGANSCSEAARRMLIFGGEAVLISSPIKQIMSLLESPVYPSPPGSSINLRELLESQKERSDLLRGGFHIIEQSRRMFHIWS